MNPDKLFDYLEGKLSPADRTELEERLMSDAQLRREFNIAREIHRSGGGAREVIVADDDPAIVQRGARLGPRIATAAMILVMLNVAGGLGVIAWKSKKSEGTTRKEAEIRKQLQDSLGAAAQKAMPAPLFSADEIPLTAPRTEWEDMASRIIAGAATFGGSGTKGLPDDNVMTVVVDIPQSRAAEFREALSAASTISPMPAISPGADLAAAGPNERSIVQIRITAPAR
ncbi:MAG: hypothetical protein M3119_06890 [Verrucomicrobiota bacterium]|nr:hypothetical protein [Verrucomicrobiota bacterium]